MFETMLRSLGIDAITLTNVIRRLLLGPSVTGYTITGTLLSGATSVSVNHGLGRVYQGAWVVSQDVDHHLSVMTPSAAVSAGDDPGKVVRLEAAAPGVNVNFTMWVY